MFLQVFLVQLDELCEHTVQRRTAEADGCEQIVGREHVELLRDCLQTAFLEQVMRIVAEMLRLLLDELEAARDILLPLLLLEPGADLRARLARGDDIEPVAARQATILSQSRLGPLFALFVMMETMSPFLSLYSSGTSLPLTFAPTQ